MMKRAWLAAAIVAMVWGCGGDNNGCPTGTICVDSGPGDVDAGPMDSDAGMADSGGPVPDGGPCGLVPGRASGAACSRDRCTDGLACQTEIAANYAGTVNRDGTAGPALTIIGFPGSMCAQVCDPDMNEGTDANNCDLNCTKCNGAILEGRVRFGISDEVPGTCRPVCNADSTTNGGCRDGYACDAQSGTCMEACVDDMQCRFSIGDVDGDGAGDIVYDMGAMARCDTATRRCYVEGNDMATAGDPCTSDAQCMDNGLCLDGEGIPGGYCTRLFCNDTLACGSGDVCYSRPFFGGSIDHVCLDGCRVGQEVNAMDVAGAVFGGNPDCRAGEMCMWDGVSAPGGDNGGCFPGNYNTERTYDVGTACQTDEDCFSPFGYGRCLFTQSTDRVQSGLCAISNCNGGGMGTAIGLLGGGDAPVALPTDLQNNVCNTGAGDLCVNFGGMDSPPNTFCIHSCDTAAECPVGYACTGLLSGGQGICWPNCEDSTDCHTGATCQDTMRGACDPMTEECYCSDAMPAPVDAGTPAVDAGSPASDAGTPASDAGTPASDAGDTDAGVPVP